MDQIPTALYDDIFVFLDTREIFGNLIHVCKSFKYQIESLHFLNIHLKLALRLDNIRWIGKENAINLLKDSKKKLNSGFLDFMPCSTDGGIDEDRECYWFGNGFEFNEKSWCTREGLLNVNASAVLAKTQVTSGYHWANQEIVKIVKSIYERKGKYFDKDAEHNAVIIFNKIMTNFPLNTIAADEPDPEAFKQLIREISINLKPFKSGMVNSQRFSNRNDVLDMPIDANSADNSSIYAVINKICISRKGAYTCPVKTLMIFVSHTYIDILDSSLKFYNDMREYENLNQARDYFPLLAKPKEKMIEPGVEYCEFVWTKEKLKPVLWVNFLDNKRMSMKDIRLNEEISAKYFYVKLICPEDQRGARGWNHENMNIDCNYVVPEGRIIILD